ncbi:MAG: hypothetical protein KGN76_08635 [Acidobacteriota bacterium]|nr:hypothetical protein [Acidobacteriota bacterium]
MDGDPAAAPAPLNENQQRHLLVSCQYIDKLLTDVLDLAMPPTAASPFSRYADDLTPTQKAVLRDSVQRIRVLMIGILAAQGIAPAPGRVSAQHALHTALGFIEIAVDELRPRHMRGYGAVQAEAEPLLNGIVTDLQEAVRELAACLGRSDRRDGAAG